MDYAVHPITRERMELIARYAGDVMKLYFRSHGMERDTKSDKTPLTVADTTINATVIRWAKQLDPSIDIVGEEESCRTASPWQIVCDPIDGTFPFTWGVPVSTFMICLIYKGVVMISVIYDPWQDRMFAAEVGKGAYLNGKKLSVSKVTVKDNPVVGYVSWHNCGMNMHAILGALESQGFQLINFCSIGYIEAMVATGELAGTIFPQRKFGAFHDTAPGDLLVTEAGGVVTDLAGEPQNYTREAFNGHIMANSPTMHATLLEAVKKFG